MRLVDSADGTRIAAYEEGNLAGPTVVLVHGWPDSHVLWDATVPHLTERFRVIRYDNRGSRNSSVPKDVSSYRMANYADDFAAVIDALAPVEKVHVLAHDWGSVGMWEYLSRPEAADRIAAAVPDQLQHHLRRRGWLRSAAAGHLDVHRVQLDRDRDDQHELVVDFQRVARNGRDRGWEIPAVISLGGCR